MTYARCLFIATLLCVCARDEQVVAATLSRVEYTLSPSFLQLLVRPSVRLFLHFITSSNQEVLRDLGTGSFNLLPIILVGIGND